MSEWLWRKSTRSNQYDNCVEVALEPEVTAVRDSKNPAAGYFAVPAVTWESFLHGLKSGRFDRSC